jgi:4-alpha-glucanotransferase
MDLFSKARDLGIQTEFVDAHGRRRVTSEAVLGSMVESLPAPAPHPFINRAVAVRSDRTGRTRLKQPPTLPLRWKILAADRVVAEAEARIERGDSDEQFISWPPDLPPGSYMLHLADAASTTDKAPFIVAPSAAFSGDFDRCWLLAVQLYGVRSARNWGIGDFTDLDRLIELAAQLGADGVGLNPLHVLFDDRPADCSPYSPNSRLFLNPLYIDVERVAGFQSGEERQTLHRVRQGQIVDYAGVAALKWQALRCAFSRFTAGRGEERPDEFDRFRENSPLLSRFACFELLRHKFGKPWWEWPEEWRQPDDANCGRLRLGPDREEIEFIEFTQWIADLQLAASRRRAKELGLKVGLYLDIAVGVQSDGFDAWNEQSAISRSLAVGAPPDMLNTAGQNWGLAGFNAAGLEIRSFEPYRQMLRASMRYAGAVRLDHVLGLQRLYLVPEGFAADNGVYVQMPFEALLAVTAQESVTHRCVVIGEDLGTVPEGFREQLADWGIWSYRVMMFERDPQGRFLDIDHYAANALVTFNTHDLSTYAGWRSFSDLKLKRSLGVDPGETDDERWHALTMLTEALHGRGIERHDLYGVAGLLARTKSRLLAISLEDLLGVLDQPNIPGTVHEHPNWRQRLPISIDEIATAIDLSALQNATAERAHNARRRSVSN